MGKKLPTAIAFLTALLLVGGLVMFFLLSRPEVPQTPVAAPSAPPRDRPTDMEDILELLERQDETKLIRAQSPTEVSKPRVDYGGKYHRWNLKDYPAGWNHDLALRLHELFGELEFRDEPGDGPRIEKAIAELAELLASLGPDALPTLGAILNVEPDFVARRRVFERIGTLGPESEEATRLLVDYYRARVSDPGAVSELKHLVGAMGSLKNETSFDVLRELAMNDGEQRYRPELVRALGEHPRRDDAYLVFERSLDDHRFEVRQRAAQVFGQMANPETIDTVVEAYQRERVFYARQTLLGTLAKIGEPDTIPFLEQEAREATQSGVRLSAANAIRRIVEKTGDGYGLEVLQDLSQSEPDEKIRGYIQRWTSELRT